MNYLFQTSEVVYNTELFSITIYNFFFGEYLDFHHNFSNILI